MTLKLSFDTFEATMLALEHRKDELQARIIVCQNSRGRNRHDPREVEALRRLLDNTLFAITELTEYFPVFLEKFEEKYSA